MLTLILAYHFLLLKNNTVSLSPPVKRDETERTCMITLFSLLYDKGRLLEKRWLLSFNRELTNFLEILHCFFNCLYHFPGIASVRRSDEKRRKPGGCKFEWGLEMKQYKISTKSSSAHDGQGRRALGNPRTRLSLIGFSKNNKTVSDWS